MIVVWSWRPDFNQETRAKIFPKPCFCPLNDFFGGATVLPECDLLISLLFGSYPPFDKRMEEGAEAKYRISTSQQ